MRIPFGCKIVILVLVIACLPTQARSLEGKSTDSHASEVSQTGGFPKHGNVPATSKDSDKSRTNNSPAIQGSLAELQSIQHLPGNEYTRVVLLTSAPVTFNDHAVRADATHNQPVQITVDVRNCAISPNVGSQIPVTDNFLSGISTRQLDPGQARIVLDAHQSIEAYRVFSLSNPFRVVIDIRGKAPLEKTASTKQEANHAEKHADIRTNREQTAPSQVKTRQPKIKVKPGNPNLPSLARQLSLDVKRIVLDPGHGGKDTGAISPNNTYEKNITLAIAFELKKILTSRLGCEVILTRTTDRFISLEERTAIANRRKADLFISIHTNAHTDRSLCGTETYILDFSKDSESARVAAAENASSAKKLSDLEAILHDLMLNTKIKESAQLASEVQRSVVNGLKSQRCEGVRDLGIKRAPFCVLIGAEMPCILIETAFLSNPVEEARLKDVKFRRELARGIAEGVKSYIRQIKGLAKTGELS
ncbi:MAG: N-acetylmuramoyl-L-alanine amidase [Syntrophobacteraceae bacterium]